MKTFSRARGQSAVAAAAYRSGETLHCERTGKTKYPHRSADDVVFKAMLNWKGSRNELWNAAEDAERRKNSCVAREFELALPKEASPQERERLVLEIGEVLVERYQVAVDIAIHQPPDDATNNWHAHVLFTTRGVEDGRLGAKTRVLDAKATGAKEVAALREIWAKTVNQVLPACKHVDHRSLEAQGVTDRVAGRKEGPMLTRVRKHHESIFDCIELDRWQDVAEQQKQSRELQKIEAEERELSKEAAILRTRRKELYNGYNRVGSGRDREVDSKGLKKHGNPPAALRNGAHDHDDRKLGELAGINYRQAGCARREAERLREESRDSPFNSLGDLRKAGWRARDARGSEGIIKSIRATFDHLRERIERWTKEVGRSIRVLKLLKAKEPKLPPLTLKPRKEPKGPMRGGGIGF